MIRFLACVALFALILGCCLPEDQRRTLKPLGDDNRIFTYVEMINRARTQSMIALEAFYKDNWAELGDTAEGLEKTVSFLPKTSEQPEQLKAKIVDESKALRKDAKQLAAAARAQDVRLANESLQRIHRQIRTLQP